MAMRGEGETEGTTQPATAGPEQFTQKFEGTLRGYGVHVKDEGMAAELARRGYGEKEGKKLKLRLYEALHLARLQWLTVRDGKGRQVEFRELVEKYLSEDERAWTKFLVYRDLRSRGYVVREGYGLAADLRVYARGEYGSHPAAYVVIPLNEGSEIKLSELRKTMDAIYRMGKEPIVAVVERRGETIYYKASKMVFEGP